MNVEPAKIKTKVLEKSTKLASQVIVSVKSKWKAKYL